MTGVSIVILNSSESAERLDRAISSFYATNTHSPVELIVLDYSDPASTKEVLAKHSTKGFIRHIKAAGKSSSSPERADPVDLLTEEVFSRARHPYLLIRTSSNGFTQDIIPNALEKLSSTGKSVVGLPGADSSQPTEQGFFCRKHDFASLKDLLHSCKKDLDVHQEKTPAVVQTRAAPDSVNVLYVSHSRLSTNSGYHVQYYANMAAHQGASVIVATPKINANEQFMYDSFRVQAYQEIETNGISFPDGHGPDIVHAWSPREKVRKLCVSLTNRYSFKTVIHLEDNEEYLTENSVGQSFEDLSALPHEDLDQLIPQNRFHPINGWQWLKQADGLTMIIDTLQRFNPNGHPSIILPAPVDERLFYPRPINYKLRKKQNIPDNHVVLAYIGNVRSLKRREASELYQAITLLNDQGIPATLIRTGENHVSLDVDKEKYKQYEKSLGWVERTEIPDILAAADILVQPGRSGPFDDQRVPAKLPEYFAMGRPVILPQANLGLMAEHGKEAYVLDRADAEGIAGAVRELSRDKYLLSKLAMGAAGFYRTRLQKNRVAQELNSYYSNTLAN